MYHKKNRVNRGRMKIKPSSICVRGEERGGQKDGTENTITKLKKQIENFPHIVKNIGMHNDQSQKTPQNPKISNS